MPGEVNWFEIPAADTAKAREFYGKLFGWRTIDVGQDYHVLDTYNGAVGARSETLTQPRVYFSTDDLEATLQKVSDLGATAGEIIEIPKFGRIAHCCDLESTPFSLYQPAQR